MFPRGSSTMYGHTRDLLQKVVAAIRPLPHTLAVAGYTDSTPFANEKGYSNWELSSDRANASRRALIDLGFQTSFSGRWGPAVERSFLAVLHLKGQENLPATVRLPAPRLDPSEHTAFQWVAPEEALQRLVHEAHRESLALALRAWVR